MIPPARLYLDTNIFIALVEQDGVVPNLLGALVKAKPDAKNPYFTTSELTFSEVAVKPYRDGALRTLKSYDSMLISSAWLQVGPVDRSVLYHAAVLRADNRHLKLPDAIHISTAMGCGCTHLLTADQGIGPEYQLSYDSREIPTAPVSLTILRPDEPTLTSLLQSLAA